MTKASRKPRSKTADQILDLAERLIQTRGYSAFSYQDIADALSITKASIHYHFASKAELGLATLERYTERFDAALSALAADEAAGAPALLDFYTAPYLAYAETADHVCLCGALAGEVMALPADMRAGVVLFFAKHQAWLTLILERGAARDEFQLPLPAPMLARVMFGALQGALLIKRATNDASQLRDVIAGLTLQLERRAS